MAYFQAGCQGFTLFTPLRAGNVTPPTDRIATCGTEMALALRSIPHQCSYSVVRS